MPRSYKTVIKPIPIVTDDITEGAAKFIGEKGSLRKLLGTPFTLVVYIKLH